jgi:hypothetical protein
MFDIDGAIDMHVHSGPDLIGRVGDDFEIATRSRDGGMAGMAVKSHLESTASRAYLTNKVVPGFRYYGGVCLNFPVGGINPAAVDACLNLGGRIVWMPSSHAKYHAKLTGKLGNWGYSDMNIYSPADSAGITILAEDGELTSAAKEVVSLVREHNAVVATSHLSPEEILALSAFTKEQRVKLVFTHIMWTPEYDLALGQRVVDNGGTIEIASSVVGGYTQRMSLTKAADMISTYGAENIILASDAGGVRHPHPHEALRVLANNLIEKDVTPDALRTMLCHNPTRLLES